MSLPEALLQVLWSLLKKSDSLVRKPFGLGEPTSFTLNKTYTFDMAAISWVGGRKKQSKAKQSFFNSTPKWQFINSDSKANVSDKLHESKQKSDNWPMPMDVDSAQ